MGVLDIEKNDLLRLSEKQLEELIAKLAKADIKAHGHSSAYVYWSGSIHAPDKGIDIHVKITDSELNTGFLTRPDTILQSKKIKMPRSEILKEMQKNTTRLTLFQQEEISGSYIIVSLADNCSPAMMSNRLTAMHDAIPHDLNKNKIHLDFFDRSKLFLWLEEHFSVMLWVKEKLGQDYSGWQSYDSWIESIENADGSFILAPGVSVHLPIEQGQNVSINDAIEFIREIIRSSSKTIRITGLSGIGKTRIVQALFDERISINALDRTIVVYTDIDTKPDFSAHEMLNKIIAENCKSIIIIDNCPRELHYSLIDRVLPVKNKISLITIDYDIKNDNPKMTDVFRIKVDGTEIAEKLILRRFSSLDKDTSRKIAEFAGGNALISLTIAERAQQGGSLAELSDETLLNRLLLQRSEYDNGNIREQAEVLSLVYSFSDDDSDLKILGSICGYTEDSLRRTVKKLKNHGIIQDRNNYQTIFPDAIANRLAASEIKEYRIKILYNKFKESGNDRLSKSFANRLKIMRDNGLIENDAIKNISEELHLLLE